MQLKKEVVEVKSKRKKPKPNKNSKEWLIKKIILKIINHHCLVSEVVWTFRIYLLNKGFYKNLY